MHEQAVGPGRPGHGTEPAVAHRELTRQGVEDRQLLGFETAHARGRIARAAPTEIGDEAGVVDRRVARHAAAGPGGAGQLREYVVELVPGIADLAAEREVRARSRRDVAACGIGIGLRIAQQIVDPRGQSGDRIGAADVGDAEHVVERAVLEHQHEHVPDPAPAAGLAAAEAGHDFAQRDQRAADVVPGDADQLGHPGPDRAERLHHPEPGHAEPLDQITPALAHPVRDPHEGHAHPVRDPNPGLAHPFECVADVGQGPRQPVAAGLAPSAAGFVAVVLVAVAGLVALVLPGVADPAGAAAPVLAALRPAVGPLLAFDDALVDPVRAGGHAFTPWRRKCRCRGRTRARGRGRRARTASALLPG